MLLCCMIKAWPVFLRYTHYHVSPYHTDLALWLFRYAPLGPPVRKGVFVLWVANAAAVLLRAPRRATGANSHVLGCQLHVVSILPICTRNREFIPLTPYTPGNKVQKYGTRYLKPPAARGEQPFDRAWRSTRPGSPGSELRNANTNNIRKTDHGWRQLTSINGRHCRTAR